jgi:hypothetical protein
VYTVKAHLGGNAEHALEAESLQKAREAARLIFRDGLRVTHEDGTETLYPPGAVYKVTVTPPGVQS